MNKETFLNLYRSVSRGYIYRELGGGIGVYRLPTFDACASIDHGFSARTGGVSTGVFSSLNLSFTRPEQREHVMENYRRFSSSAGIPWDSMIMDSYEHGTTILRVDHDDCGKGYLYDPLPPCDGVQGRADHRPPGPEQRDRDHGRAGGGDHRQAGPD